MSSWSLGKLLAEVAAPRGDAPAILAPGLKPLSYAELQAQIDAVGAALRGRVAPDGRIAVIAADSATTALVTVALMCHRALTPLDARLARQELSTQLRRLRAALVVVGDDDPASPARLAAAEAGVPVVRFVSRAPDSIAFSLEGLDALPAIPAEPVAPRGGSDIAMIACTSGTTGKPKLVPLTHDNLLSAMIANVDVLDLMAADRCLGIMPLCHIHGLGAVLCALLAGGSIAVLPGFSAAGFYEGLVAFDPTWYTAVPTIHGIILDHASAHEATLAQCRARGRLRMARSGSAPMPAGIPERLEATFGARYVEASGATEASAYLCSNRPATRRIGSVGNAMPGTELRIVNDAGVPVAVGEIGELIARGPGIFAGYEDDPDSTQAAFRDGFFRTGDLARVDADGFYYLTGRLKEQINRGGMKVSPVEVEAALSDHPAVAAVAAFGIPDARLGQEVGAVVVLRTAGAASAIELQRHVAERLADFKVPRRIVFADRIPVGPRGKVQRLQLAAQLGLDADAPSPPPPAAPPAERDGRRWPETLLEQTLAAIWSEELDMPVNDVDEPFHAMGGDSMQAMSVCLAVEKRFKRSMPLAAMGDRPTIRAMAQLLESDGFSGGPAEPIMLRSGDKGDASPTLFVLPGVGGNVYSYHGLARDLPFDWRVIGLPLPGADGLEPPYSSLQPIVDRYWAHIRRLQPRGPYVLVGYSFGGRAACELAARLRDAGERVALLALLDVLGPGWPPPKPLWRRLTSKCRTLGEMIAGRKPWRIKSAATIIAEQVVMPDAPEEIRLRQEAMIAACNKASENWASPPLAGIPVTLFRAAIDTWTALDLSDRTMGWSGPTQGTVRVVDVPGSHVTMLHAPHVAALAKQMSEVLKGVDGRPST